jgi:hypothetical protein
MASCPACGAELRREWRHCVACGAPVTRRRRSKVAKIVAVVAGVLVVGGGIVAFLWYAYAERSHSTHGVRFRVSGFGESDMSAAEVSQGLAIAEFGSCSRAAARFAAMQTPAQDKMRRFG